MSPVLDFKAPYKSSLTIHRTVSLCLCALLVTIPRCLSENVTNSTLFQKSGTYESITSTANLRGATTVTSVEHRTGTTTYQKQNWVYTPFNIWDTDQYKGFIRDYSSSSGNQPATDDLVTTDVQTMVVGGTTVSSITDYPYMTYIYFNINGAGTRCGGSLITPDLILTAAHCLPQTTDSSGNKVVDDSNPLGSTSRAMLGATYRYDKYGAGVENFGLVQYYHAGFYQVGSTPPTNDIAIIKLDGCSTFQPVSLNSDTSKDDVAGTQVQIIGWGEEYYSGGGNGGKYLKYTNQYIDTSCSYWGSEKTDNMICAAQSGTGPCFGDSGGPLVLRGSSSNGSGDVQIGVVSSGSKCADVSETPDIYTRISMYYSWIESVKQNSECPSPNYSYTSATYSSSSSSASTYSAGEGSGSGSSSTGRANSQSTSTSPGSKSLEYLVSGGVVTQGGMFSVQALTNVIITSLSLQLQSSGTYDSIIIYTRSGSPDGYELSSSGWTKVGSTSNVQSEGPGLLSQLPSGSFSPISVAAGQILSFYVYSETANQNMVSQSGSSIGVSYASNTEMSILQHSANTDAFKYVWKPYKWNGSVIYTTS
jgi:trypsin